MRIVHKSRRSVPLIQPVADLIQKLVDTPNEDLPDFLSQIDVWKWPRSDLNAWVKVLNKLDAIMEDIIRDYEIDKLQRTPFSPFHKRLLSEILRFERLLLENSTNRKTYNSYDRLSSLMTTSDLDILVLSLNLLLRPAQQYSAQPSVCHALNISTPKLASLAKRWPNLHDFDISLAAIASSNGKAQTDALPNEAREVVFTFYKKDNKQATGKEKEKAKEPERDVFDAPPVTPRKGAAVQIPASGPVTIHIDSQTLESKETMEIWADAIEAYEVPDDEKYELLCRIRTARAFTRSHESEREKLVIIRLLAIALFCHTHPEHAAYNYLFLYEPDLVIHVAELLQLDRGVDIHVQTGAIYALDAVGRYRNKIQDVLTAVNAGVNHGVLMALLRKTVGDLAHEESNTPQPFVESILSFVTYIAAHAAGGNMVVGAGLIPLLVQVIENRLSSRLYALSKTMQLLDNVLYGYTNAFQLFCNARGVDVLVNRIEYEVDIALEEHEGDKPASEIPIPHGKISVIRGAVLKHILRSMHRMMQTSGASEGLRGLLDSSLMKSVKKILLHRDVFGANVLAIAINIMSTFVHNEPTCLAVIQEAGLPEAFYKVVESGLEPVIEVIQSVPNAIGALCLNQVGQDQLSARPGTIPALFSVFTSEKHQRILQEKENAVLIGTAVEELVRHHPSIKKSVFDSIQSTLKEIEALGNGYVVPEEHEQWYKLRATQLAEPSQDVADTDVDMTPSADTTVTPSSTATLDPHSYLEESSKGHDNVVVSYIDVFGKFMEGYFQHVPHCRDFVSDPEGMDCLGRLTALPCLPYDFPNSVASDSLVQVVRTMLEAATNETLLFVVSLVSESLAETKHLRDDTGGESKLSTLANANATALPSANTDFRKLITLHIRIMLLSDVLASAGYTQGRATATLLQALNGRVANGILLSLGSLHRSCIWENLALKNAQISETTETAPRDLASADSSALTPAAGSSSTIEPNGTQDATSNVPTPQPSQSRIHGNPKESNIKALKHIASQLPNALAPFYQAVVRLFQTRRGPDASQKQRIADTSQLLAQMLVDHLSPRTTDDKQSLYAYYTMMLGLCNVLLIDERSNSKIVNTVLLRAFYRKDGLEAILALCRAFTSTIEDISTVPGEERSPASTQELIHAHGGLKVALHLLLPIITFKSTLDSPQTASLATPGKKENDPDYFEAHSFVVRMRVAVLPLVKELWEASWLVSAPLSVSKSTIQLVLELLNTEHEETKDSIPEAAASMMASLPIHRTIGADENRLRQLVDMGFPRPAAERALIRTRNNVSAATELLLSQPLPIGIPIDHTEPAEPVEPVEPTEPAAPPADIDATAPSGSTDPTDVPANAAPNDGTQTPVPETAEAGPSTSAEPPISVEPAVQVTVKTPEEWLSDLKTEREPLKSGLGQRALTLVDEHPSLVFDVQRVFVGPSTGYRDEAVRLLMDDVKKFSSAAYDHQEQPLSARCRLLALVLNDPASPLASLSEAESTSLMGVLVALLLSNPINIETGTPTIPKWLASHLLVTEALFMLGEEPRSITLPKEGEPIPQEPLNAGSLHTEARNRVFDFCLRLISMSALPKDELLSALRLFVLLTRDHNMAVDFVKREGVVSLFRILKGPSTSVDTNSSHPYIAAILRHVVEDSTTLQQIMTKELKQFFSHPRNRLVDVTSFVKSCSSMALRDPATFIQIASEVCQLSNPYSISKSVSPKASLKEKPPTQPAEENADVEMQVDPPSTKVTGSTSESLDAFVHFLISELMKSIKPEAPPDAATQDQTTSANTSVDYTYPCFVMQCLTELLFSYDSCKVAFLSYPSKKRTHTPGKEAGIKHRTAALQFLITELMSFGTINPTPPPEAKQQIMLCNWAMSVVVALCVDTSPTDIKDVPPERASVRKFVLEAINRAIKDLPPSETGEARYSRVLALADLCYRLLTVRFNAAHRKANDESPTHISKVMLEKNFVATLTNALAEVDPNFPNIRGVVTGILRPLEYLTKIAIRMSRASDKHKDSAPEKEESVGSDISDEDEDTEDADADRDETPDLYRNSSLGMYGGEMEDVHYGHDDDDEMDEDAEEEDEDAEMDYDNETGSEDTSNTDEEDEEAMEEDLENETGDSEGDWHDEDEDEEGLVENDEEQEGDEDDDDVDDEDDEAAADDVLWQEVAVAQNAVADAVDDLDGDDHDTIPIAPATGEDEEDDGDLFEGTYAESLDDFTPEVSQPPPDGFAGFVDALAGVTDANPREPHMFWHGMVRPGRRRGNVDDDMEIFGRSRGTPSAAPEGAVHPLLQDPSAAPQGAIARSRSSRRPVRGDALGFPQDLLTSIENAIGEGAIHLFQHIMTGRGPGETVRIDVPAGGLIPQLGRHGRPGISAHIRLDRGPRPNDGRSDGRGFEPLLTLDRWGEEVKTLHGRFESSRASKLANHLALSLLPAAVEAHKLAKAEEEKEAEKRRKAEEEAEALRLEQEAKENAEAARLEEERLAAERAAQEEIARAAQTQDEPEIDAEMADASSSAVENEDPHVGTTEDQPEAGTSTAPERVTVMIHGNPVDITDTGIDPTFLEALPDDMREEVLNQHVRDQRAARVERPDDSQISPEFLDALPPELRAEIIQQENMERTRRRDPAAPAAPARPPTDMDAADFIASLDPHLRQVVLMDSDETLLQGLPPHVLAEVGIYGEMPAARVRAQQPVTLNRRTQPGALTPATKPAASRDAIQLLDKHAIAVLVRLLFFPQVLRKNVLSKVLVNLSENTKTRTDIFNLLLSILQDGTGDLSSIDKSFAQMSVRSSKPAGPSTPRPAGKSTLPQPEVVPELVAQRCLDALSYITGTNEASSVFFLTEQELPAGLRRATSKKGKGKEKQTPQTYYPIVLLLGQLDRQALLRTPTLMEAVVGLLALITRPLVSLKDTKQTDESGQSSSSNTAVPTEQSPQPTETVQAEPSVTPAPSQPSQPVQPDPPAAPVALSAPGTSAPATSATQQEKVLLSQPPVIPHTVLRLVVNILTAGECSGRAFSHTLTLIQNLSFIPEARDVVAQELCTRAQEFGVQLYNSLDDLAIALRGSNDEAVSISIASTFSPASSDQAKLLRVLKTIDYMYSPKSVSPTTNTANEDVEKVQSIYEGFRFTALWQRLGDCLAIIEEKAELEHIATVLLPLIESLMVVCKYVGPKTISGAATRALRASASPRTPTSARESMEDVFVSFTDAHRKVLNLLVRNNPSLMSGSFSLLVNNPRVLDFDNKRNYFNQQLHRRPATREHYSTLQLNVRRPRVFEDSFQYLQRKTGEQIKYGKLSVRFYDEEGVDAGGVTREWFQILARQMFNPDYCLFQPCAADRLTYQPNKASSINPEHLSFFKFVGRIIGKAIYDGRLLDAYFARSLYRQLLGKPVDYRDVEWVDPEYYKSLCWILENDPSVLDLTFILEADEFGVTQIVELKENGAQLPVTQENKREFVQLSAQHRLYLSIKDQIEALLAGFYEIIPKDLVTIFDEKELELLISGTPDIDVDEWRAATEYNGYTSSDPVIVWFWRALKSFNREERAKVLSFATGTSRVPLGGFVDLQGVQGTQRFSIHRAYGEMDRLPQAHTCFNQIDLPQYSSYEMLRQQLLLAIHEGGEGFGFA